MNAQAEGQKRVVPGMQLSDETAAQQQLVACYYGVGRRFAQCGGEQV